MAIIQVCITFICAVLVGRLVSKIKLPAILGWLIAGMFLGPHALNILTQQIMDSQVFVVIVHILECAVGLMIGTELVWKKLKEAGRQIIITTLTQSLGTFLLVSLVFGICFYFMDIPIYLVFIFGGIALATAPAPALSIVREFHTRGPVTKTLIPMAALDDMVGVVVFFTVISIISSHLSSGAMSSSMIVLIVILPLVIGAILGLVSGTVMKKITQPHHQLANLIISILVCSIVGLYINQQLLPEPIMNFMLMGMAYSAVIANMMKERDLMKLMENFNPILSVAMILVILNLGAPLDYHLVLGAGLFTAIYIISRALGKYFGARFGATITKSPETVQKYLGLTLLPHSGVSLVFTGIAVNTLQGPAPECAKIIQGTIAAAAVINEIIAVIIAKKGFEWAKEMKSEEDK